MVYLFEPIKLAKDLGIKVIVTDHHDIAYIEDDRVINNINYRSRSYYQSKRWDCQYPFKQLCGAG